MSELTSQNVKFSRLFFGNNITAQNEHLLQRVEKGIDIPGSYLRRKLTWLGDLIRDEEEDRVAKKIALGNDKFFKSHLFGETWENALRCAMNQGKWEDFVEGKVFAHGANKGEIPDRGAKGGGKVGNKGKGKGSAKKGKGKGKGKGKKGSLLEGADVGANSKSENTTDSEKSEFSINMRDIDTTSDSDTHMTYTADDRSLEESELGQISPSSEETTE